MTEEEKKLLRGLFDSLSYMFEEEDLHALYEELIIRIEKLVDYPAWSDLGNIIYGMIICTYGDYGTSPRSGWFENEAAKKDILAIIRKERNDLEKYTEWGQEKFGERDKHSDT